MACAALAVLLVIAVVAMIGAKDGAAPSAPVGSVDGSQASFTWEGHAERYRVELGDGTGVVTERAAFSIDAVPGSRVCITVAAVTGDETGPASARSCVDVQDGVD